MSTVTERILVQAKTLPEGALISAKELLQLGTRAAVDQALKRLEQRKELMRLSRGVYVRPVATRFGSRAPAAEKIIASIAASHAETIVNHGAAAANALGLTTQVPTKLVYLTSGRNRRLHLGGQVVEMKHAPTWMLLPSHRAAGEAVRALTWIGPDRVSEALAKLKQTLPSSTVEELVALRPALPSWMAESIGKAFLQETIGSVEPIRKSLEPYSDKIRAAFVFGSVAKGTDTASSDVDVMIIGDELDYSGLYTALNYAETMLHRKVSPIFLSPHDWKRKAAQKDSFVGKVSVQPKIFILGSEKDVRL